MSDSIERKRISRHGLTCCPRCNRYTNARTGGLSCQFCGEHVLASGAGRAMKAVFASGKGGLLAASLFGLSALPACDDGAQNPDATGADAIVDMANEAGGTDIFDVAPEATVGDVYGAPADIPDNGPETFDIAPEATFGDVYGAPADIPDTFETVQSDVPSDAVYGGPPDVADE